MVTVEAQTDLDAINVSLRLDTRVLKTVSEKSIQTNPPPLACIQKASSFNDNSKIVTPKSRFGKVNMASSDPPLDFTPISVGKFDESDGSISGWPLDQDAVLSSNKSSDGELSLPLESIEKNAIVRVKSPNFIIHPLIDLFRVRKTQILM